MELEEGVIYQVDDITTVSFIKDNNNDGGIYQIEQQKLEGEPYRIAVDSYDIDDIIDTNQVNVFEALLMYTSMKSTMDKITGRY